MSMPVEKSAERVTVEEYLRREAAATERHEFHDGEILAMSGGTFNHAQVKQDLSNSLAKRLAGTGCSALSSDMRVATTSFRHYVYPDVLIKCGPPQFDPADVNKTTILNARVVFEVLSGSTEAYDRGEKFDRYRQSSALEEYVLVSQNTPTIQSFLRQSDGTWNVKWWRGLEAVAQVRCLPIDLPLAELYANVELLPDPSA